MALIVNSNVVSDATNVGTVPNNSPVPVSSDMPVGKVPDTTLNVVFVMPDTPKYSSGSSVSIFIML